MIDLYTNEYMHEYGAKEAYNRWIKTQTMPAFDKAAFEREFLGRLEPQDHSQYRERPPPGDLFTDLKR